MTLILSSFQFMTGTAYINTLLLKQSRQIWQALKVYNKGCFHQSQTNKMCLFSYVEILLILKPYAAGRAWWCKQGNKGTHI